jgi:hypothetical protein
MRWRQDFRLSPDVPPLWEYWISLPIARDAVRIDTAPQLYRGQLLRASWVEHVAYQTPGNDGEALVRDGRRMSLILGVALAALIGRWAWELAGAVAAVAATFLYCLDPNFLGHAPLAKNDVAAALFYAATAYALWRLGRQFTLRRAAAVVILTAAAVAVKFSGLLLGPVLVGVLTLRCLVSEPWLILGRVVKSRAAKLAAATAVMLAAFIASYILIWACYAFRFDAGPAGQRLDPTPMLADARPTLFTRAVLYCEQRHLLPQSWAMGFLYSQLEDRGDRPAFLLGETYTGGKWYYFPLAAGFKSPLATMAAALLALAGIRRRIFACSENRWAGIALIVPVVVYAMAALTADINIGLRHVFPIYPFVFIAVGLGLSRVWNIAGCRWLILLLAAMLIAETAQAYPNYIAFFNSACRSRRLSLLADSNLDWGQDLPLLAAWQREHPQVTLYLDYRGRCDPAAYGIHYINLPDGFEFGPEPALPAKPGMVAISATLMQLKLNAKPEDWKALGLSPDSRPDEILGGTIYLFHVNPTGS